MSDLYVGFYRTNTPTERGIVFSAQFLHQQRMFRGIPGIESLSPFIYSVQDHRNYIRVTASQAGHFAILDAKILDVVTPNDPLMTFARWSAYDRPAVGATWAVTLASPMAIPYVERRTHYRIFFSLMDFVQEISSRARKLGLWPEEIFDPVVEKAAYELAHLEPCGGDFHITDVYSRNNKVVRGLFGLLEFDIYDLCQAQPGLQDVLGYMGHLLGGISIGYRDLALAVPNRPDLNPFLTIQKRPMFLSVEPLGGFPTLMPAG